MKTFIKILLFLIVSNSFSQTVNFSYTLSNSGCAPATITVKNLSTGCAKFRWDWGDGKLNTISSLKDTIHNYSKPGGYYIYLYGLNASGNQLGVTYIYIQVKGLITYVPDSACFNEDITMSYSNYGSFSNILNWNFGDGTSENNYSTIHQYKAAGKFIINVTSNIEGCGQKIVKDSIKIKNNITLTGSQGFYINPKITCPGHSIYFSSLKNKENRWIIGTKDTNLNYSYYYSLIDTGKYPISLTIKNGCGSELNLKDTIEIKNNIPVVNASFNLNEKQICIGQEFSVNANATNYYSFIWNFGDGQKRLGNYVDYSYSKPGTYVVSLKAFNGCDRDTTIKDTIIVKQSKGFKDYISYSISPSNRIACPGTSLSFSNYSENVKKQEWDFGNGIKSTERYTNTIFKTSGKYKIKLKLTSFCDVDTVLYDSVIISDSIPFNANPFTISPKEDCQNKSISFNSNQTVSLLSCKWQFGSDTTKISGTWISKSFNNVGKQVVRLYLENYCNKKDTLIDTVLIKNSMPLKYSGIYFSKSDKKVCINENISLQVNNSQNFQKYVWRFGINDSSTSYYINKSFTASGKYPFSLRLKGFCGGDTIIYDTIYVLETMPFLGTLYYNAYPTIVCPQTPIEYSISSYKSIKWDFGDSTSSTEQCGKHLYAKKGFYKLTVTVTTNCGAIAKNSSIIMVREGIPVADAEIDEIYPKHVCPGTFVNFEGWAEGASSYEWDFNDGSKGSGLITNHSFKSPGIYFVKFSAINTCGEKITVKDTVFVENNADFYSSDYSLSSNYYNCLGDEVVIILSPAINGSFLFITGDGNTVTKAETVKINNSWVNVFKYTYKKPGYYNYYIIATNSCGKSIAFDNGINISETSQSTFNSDINFDETNHYCKNSAVQFSSLNANTYEWNFGDGKTLTETNKGMSNVSHIYNVPGNYIVQLITTNGCNKKDTVTQKVLINNCISENEELTLNTSSALVFPNPFDSEIKINLENLTDVNSIELYNAIGNKIISKSVNPLEQSIISISTQTFVDGMYVLVIKGESFYNATKLIKKK